ncbi:efflux RND transporter permease subunit [Pseudomaricurvus alkylphenolicus]|uniref:efflux RND transporter permease subunit n=1 Tax=Pseudomaricurvus alkylphenolicus TaxID=1306991 RepID=UPI00141FB9BD|nr:efflux RND transporter permease subunit [Pseudomaricurvus alkylphenolicus]NIB41645.1 efflux RND transporter permease subunit [Pseudomaricurvus alkylphenolicus]
MTRLVDFFIDNPVAANLLMLAILLGGFLGLNTINKEVFPATEQNVINVTMIYPGAGPQEVEQQIVVRIEEAVSDLAGVFQITSSSRQSSGNVRIEVIEGFDIKQLLNDIKARVDAINTFPPRAERPIVSHEHFRPQLMFFSLYGDADEATLKRLGQQVRDEMPLLDGISDVTYNGARADEVSIEISENTLRKYRLTFEQVARAIRQSSVNLPAGMIQTPTGGVQVQTREQAYSAQDFAEIVVLSNRDGSQLTLGDIAEIRDGFAEEDLEVTYNGKPALDFTVHISDNPDLFGGTAAARQYIEDLRSILPPGLDVTINYEMRELFDSRVVLLTSNAGGGLLLVFSILMLFLRPLLGAWVCLGIVTAFAGAFWSLPYAGISLNMLSLFAFLMVLGIVVDDAIVVGESIYSCQQLGTHNAASEGARRVMKPVILAVLSTIIFFLPMLGVPTAVAPFTHSIFYVVAFCLVFSLIECLLILPCHLAHLKPERASRFSLLRKLSVTRSRVADGLMSVAKRRYRPLLQSVIGNRGATLIGFTLVFMISVALYIGGWVGTSFFPNVPQSFLSVNITLPEGTAFEDTQAIADRIERIAIDMRDDEKLIKINQGKPFLTEIKKTARAAEVNLFVGLMQPEKRVVNIDQVSARLRKLIGPMPEAKSFSLVTGFGNNSADIQLNLNVAANDYPSQLQAVNAVKETLAAYPGVENVRSSLQSERVEVVVGLRDHATTLGITTETVARQLRQGLYGEEVQRIPRAKEDVRVMLHYPKADRSHLGMLDSMRIRTEDGTEIPLSAVADIHLMPGFSAIERTSRKRNISITADTVEGVDALAIYHHMMEKNALQWQRSFPGFDLSSDGNLRSQAQFGEGLARNFLMALLAVYALMAVAFKSYGQPFIILTAVPFGFTGGLVGHLLLGHDISMMSFFGFLACAGVVVNDNLVLLDRLNHLRSQGVDIVKAALTAGQDRFRPIVLTSLTTFVGLLPILFEQSSQAKFLIPMVISLGFGVLFASVVTLFLVPCLYVIWDRWTSKLGLFYAKVGGRFGGVPHKQA